jgi:hypothetical protein
MLTSEQYLKLNAEAAAKALDDIGELIDQLAGNAREFDFSAANRMERDAAKALLIIEGAINALPELIESAALPPPSHNSRKGCPMTTLDELEKLLAEATQGEWYRSNNMDYVVGEDGPIAECEPIEGYFRKHVANGALIVAAINALPGLIESARRVERLEAALKPFAEFEEAIRQSYKTHRDTDSFYIYNMTAILMGDLRRARAALKGT